MAEWYERTERLLGAAAMEKLKRSRVAVFGLGGVGGHAVEALARSGVGALDLIDSDTVALSNLNRQIIATRDTVGMAKTDAAAARVKAINPECEVRTYRAFFLPETADQFDFTQYDYVVDAIDTVAGKLALALKAQEAGVPAISAMGAGNKLDPTAFEVADLYETSICPLAKVMRREGKKRGIKKLKVVYSKEPALTPFPVEDEETGEAACECETAGGGPAAGGETVNGGPADSGEGVSPRKRVTPGSTAFVPAVAGLIMAGEVIKDLTAAERKG